MAASGGPGPITLNGVSAPADGHAIRVVADGTPVAVFNRGGAYYAIGAACTHVGGPLDQGQVSDHKVRCPWHGSVFDLTTGAVVQGPARTPVKAYKARFESGALILDPV
jgi:nitrite reductase/ring-hydroxylating ferredoxin subunit